MNDTPETPDIRLPRTSVISRLRNYFFTGLVITAPIAITIWATYWFVTLFDAWVKPFIPAYYNPDNYLPFELPGFGLIFALASITIIGALAANLVGRTLIGWWDKLLNRTPVVRSIYKGSKQIFETIFSQKGASFRYVCLVEWPRRGTWSLGFVSREVDGGLVGLEAGRQMYAVYVSTTPNPTSGYVFFADKDDVQILDMTVEDGLKLVISMGLVFPDRPARPADELAKAGHSRRVSQKKAT
ncbi:MAG: DUF502 domain-containing protein [Aestuariivirga sp.]